MFKKTIKVRECVRVFHHPVLQKFHYFSILTLGDTEHLITEAGHIKFATNALIKKNP